MIEADGTRWICDQDNARTADDCANNGLQLIGDEGSTSTQLIGVKSGSTLRLRADPTSPQSLETIPLPSGPPNT